MGLRNDYDLTTTNTKAVSFVAFWEFWRGWIGHSFSFSFPFELGAA